jgi:hypothetical protein
MSMGAAVRTPFHFMKILTVTVIFAAMAGEACAQQMDLQRMGIQPGVQQAYVQPAHSLFFLHPYTLRGDMSPSRFWTRSTISLIAIDGAAKAADSLATRQNIDGGGEEHDPMARPFVHTTSLQVSSMAALFGAELTCAYLLHKRRHDNLGHLILAAGAVMNGLGAATSFDNRGPR